MKSIENKVQKTSPIDYFINFLLDYKVKINRLDDDNISGDFKTDDYHIVIDVQQKKEDDETILRVHFSLPYTKHNMSKNMMEKYATEFNKKETKTICNITEGFESELYPVLTTDIVIDSNNIKKDFEAVLKRSLGGVKVFIEKDKERR